MDIRLFVGIIIAVAAACFILQWWLDRDNPNW